MGLSLGCNKNLCVVINKDLFSCMVECAKYSDEFIYKRVSTFISKGIPSNSTNSLAKLARSVKLQALSDTAIKYLSARQYVISDDLKVGTYLTGHKPYSIVNKGEDGNIKVGGGIKL